MRLLEIYNRVLNKEKMSFEECLEFINLIISVLNPGKKCERELLNILASHGIMNNIIHECCNIIYRNSMKFDIVTYTVTRDRSIIKQWAAPFN